MMLRALILAALLALPTSGWAADSFYFFPTLGSGLKMDTDEVSSEHRQKVVICGASSGSCIEASTSPPGTSAAGMVVRNVLHDTVGSTVAMNDAADRASVKVAGQWGTTVRVESGTLIATGVARGSTDGGSTWTVECVFIAQNGQVGTTISFDNPNDVEERAIFCPVPVPDASLAFSSFTSGSANATARSMANNSNIMVSGSDGGVVRVLATTSSGVLKVECTGGTCSGSGGTAQADAATFTQSSSNITPVGFFYHTSPSAVSSGQAGVARMNVNRIAMFLPTTTTGSSIVDDTNTAIRATLVTIPEIGGRSASAEVTPFVNCKTAYEVTLDAVEKQALTPISSSNQFPRLCEVFITIISATGNGNVSIVEGDGTNCSTNEAAVTGGGPWRISHDVLPAIRRDGVIRQVLQSTNHTRQLCAKSDSASVTFRVSGSYVSF